MQRSQIFVQSHGFCLPHLHSTHLLEGFPSEYCHAVWYGKSRMVWLPDGEKISKISLFVLAQFMNVTDGQTDTTWRHRPCLCITSRGKNIWRGAVAPQGRAQMPNILRFGTFLVYCQFLPLHILLLTSPLFCLCPLSHFTAPFPFPKEVNKKLSYHRQNVLSIIKHTNSIMSVSICCFYPFHMPVWTGRRHNVLDLSVRPAVCQFVCPFVQLSVRSFVRSSSCLSVRLSVRPSVCPFVCPFVQLSVRSFVSSVLSSVLFVCYQLVNTILWKRMNRFSANWYKSFPGNDMNGRRRGSGGQRSRSLEAEVIFGRLAETSFSIPWVK